jgi:hypothetical protein
MRNVLFWSHPVNKAIKISKNNKGFTAKHFLAKHEAFKKVIFKNNKLTVFEWD